MILYISALNSLEVERDILRRLGQAYEKHPCTEHAAGHTQFSVIIIVEEHTGA